MNCNVKPRRQYGASTEPVAGLQGPFLESPDDNGPGKLLLFIFKIEVSIVLQKI